jgi:hypothetical protein
VDLHPSGPLHDSHGGLDLDLWLNSKNDFFKILKPSDIEVSTRSPWKSPAGSSTRIILPADPIAGTTATRIEIPPDRTAAPPSFYEGDPDGADWNEPIPSDIPPTAAPPSFYEADPDGADLNEPIPTDIPPDRIAEWLATGADWSEPITSDIQPDRTAAPPSFYVVDDPDGADWNAPVPIDDLDERFKIANALLNDMYALEEQECRDLEERVDPAPSGEDVLFSTDDRRLYWL